MATAKDIVLKPISSKQANELVKRVHYSGKVVQNSQLHIGVFLHGKLEGVMQFGPSLDKRKIQGLVSGTGWNEFIELNRMAFTDAFLLSEVKKIMRVVTNGGTSADKLFRLMGGTPAPGYQLRYIYFLEPSMRTSLTVSEIPFSQIEEIGAKMYRGKRAIEAGD